MKPAYFLPVLFLVTNEIVSCKKSDIKTKPVASLNVVNAVIGGGDVKVNTLYRDSAMMYNAKVFSLNAADGTIRIYSTSDSLKPYYQQQHELKNGGTYSIFLFGNPPSPGSIFFEDVPPHYTDSAFGIRVINLATGSGPLNITTAADTSTHIFENVAYKDLTGFIKIALPKIVLPGSVTFDIRDAVTNDILLSYILPEFEDFTYPGISISKQRFKGITLVIKGIAGTSDGADAFGVFPVVTSY